MFSKDGRSKIKKQKEPFGPIKTFVYLPKGGNEGQDVFRVTNKVSSKVHFNCSRLNPGLWSVCQWTTKWMELRAAGEELKLINFLTVLCQSKEFCYKPNPEEFNEDGIKKDVMNLIKNDEEEFKHFRDLAIEDAMTVDSLSDVISMCGGGFRRKRKLNNENCRVEKLSKQEEVAAIFQSEIRSEDGLEMETMTRMRARKEISL